MSVHITFDDLTVGDSVTNQFEDDQGITFTTPTGLVIADPLSPSGSALAGAFDGGPSEFPTHRLKGTFFSQTHSRIRVLVNRFCHLNVFDTSGAQIGSVSSFPLANSMTGGTYRSVEFATGAANIASFDLFAIGPQGFYLGAVVFDDTSATHRPDFRLMFSNANMPPNPGTTGFFEVTVARLYGSNGALELNVSTSPSDVISPIPALGPFNPVDGGKIRIPLTADSGVREADSITVAGTPSSSAGTSVRKLTTHWMFGLEPP